MTLLDLPVLNQLRQKTQHEWCGPCPWCGGEDRFVIELDRGKGGHYFCRQCDQRGGDGIDFLQKFYGLSYRDACAKLGLASSKLSNFSFSARPGASRKHEPAVCTPPDTWQQSAGHFLSQCQAVTLDAVDALQQERGIAPEYWARCCLGFNTRNQYPYRKDWGLKPEPGKDKIKIAAGIIIGIRRKSGIIALNSHKPRYMRKSEKDKSWIVAGSASATYAVGSAGPVLIFESPLDAALAWASWQAVGKDLIAIATMGGTKALDVDTDSVVKTASHIFFFLDGDETGDKSWVKFKARYPQAQAVKPLPGCKDIGDVYTKSQTDQNFPTPCEWLDAITSAYQSDQAFFSCQAKAETDCVAATDTLPLPKLSDIDCDSNECSEVFVKDIAETMECKKGESPEGQASVDNTVKNLEVQNFQQQIATVDKPGLRYFTGKDFGLLQSLSTPQSQSWAKWLTNSWASYGFAIAVDGARPVIRVDKLPEPKFVPTMQAIVDLHAEEILEEIRGILDKPPETD